MSDTFRILMVCTGNICRSAQAEQLLRSRIVENFPGLECVVAVESAGTGALVGSAMPEKAAALSASHGGAPAGHSGRQLTAEQVKKADLVLTMAVEHRRAVVRLLPRASRGVFTLTEFTALLENAEQNAPAIPEEYTSLDAADKLRLAVKWASERRGYLSPAKATHADVVDPYRRSDEIYEESTRQIVEALDRAQHAAVGFAQRIGA